MFCNCMLFEARYHNDEYLNLSNRLKLAIQTFLAQKFPKTVHNKNETPPPLDYQFVNLLLKFYEILDGNSRIRLDLVKFRRELEFFKSQKGFYFIIRLKDVSFFNYFRGKIWFGLFFF